LRAWSFRSTKPAETLQCVTASCNVPGMAASKLRCCVCRAPFYGRSDACYCSGACRQKAYRSRIARRTFDEPALQPPRDLTMQARQVRRQARLTRKEAVLIRAKAAAFRESRRR
jgi:hypothetical protein